MKKFLIIVILFSMFGEYFAQDIKISENLYLKKLTDKVYWHTCQGNNGMVYFHKKEAIVVSTPDSDEETESLLNWIENKKGAKIVAYIIDRWHPDAMEGLDVVQNKGIKTYAHELTREIAKAKGLPIPEIGFENSLQIEIGRKKVLCYYPRQAHTSDGIVVWVPDEEVLFAGNGIRSFNGWVGNIGDANLGDWSETARNIKKEFGNVKIVIPGHGIPGGAELIDYTISLYESSKWGKILRKHNVKRMPIFEEQDKCFIVAESDSVVGNKNTFKNCTFFMADGERFLKIESPSIEKQGNVKRIDSPYGRLQIFTVSSEIPQTDVYYERLIIIHEDDEVGLRIILRGMY